MPEYKWHPIEDIPEALYSYSDSHLQTLAQEWQNVRKETSDEILNKIIDEIKREWAIETGKIEGLYTLSRGITKTLIRHGISAKLIPYNSTNLGPNELTQILADQYEVIEGLMDYVGQRKPLTLHYIRQMHGVFTRHQDTTEGVREDGAYVQVPLLKGQWKKWPNNPEQKDKTIHEYCPPEQVQIEMEHLLELHEKHEKRHVSPEVEAAFLHHRFTQIHPFQDGNGRVARALASLVLLQANYFPFVVKDEERETYIRSLEVADQNQLSDLISFVTEKQKDLMYKALLESQNYEFDEGLNQLRELSSNYFADIREKSQAYEKLNKVILGWKSITEETLNNFKNSFDDIQTINGNLSESIDFLTYDDIHDDFELPDGLEIIDESQCFTTVIRFTKRDLDELRLYCCIIGKNNTPEKLISRLRIYFGDTLAQAEYDLSDDTRVLNLQYRKWLHDQLNQVFKHWFR